MMQTVRQVITWFVNVVTRILRKQSTIEDKAVFLMLVISVTLLVIGTVTAKYWLPVVFGLGLIVWGLSPTRQQPITPPVVPMESVFREIFRVLSEIHDRINAVRPLDLRDIIVTPPVAMRNGVEIVKAKIAKSKRGQTDPDDLRLYAKIIQARIDEHLRSGRVENIPFVSLDNQVPIFWIDRVYDDAATLYIDIIVVDNDDKLRYVINSQFAEAAPPPPEPTDEDF
jgi:hypothetical protein